MRAVGLLVGKPLGEVDGLADGLRLGDADGEADGLTLGLIVGNAVGLVVGTFVGANVEHAPCSQIRVPKQSLSSLHPLPHGSVPLHGGLQHAGHTGPPQSIAVSDPFFSPSAHAAELGLPDGDVDGDAEGNADG